MKWWNDSEWKTMQSNEKSIMKEISTKEESWKNENNRKSMKI